MEEIRYGFLQSLLLAGARDCRRCSQAEQVQNPSVFLSTNAWAECRLGAFIGRNTVTLFEINWNKAISNTEIRARSTFTVKPMLQPLRSSLYGMDLTLFQFISDGSQHIWISAFYSALFVSFAEKLHTKIFGRKQWCNELKMKLSQMVPNLACKGVILR